jgi:hypothetical protein
MNERIRKFVEQSGLDRILEEHAHEYGNGMLCNTPYPEVEKFAEMIVRECLSKVDEVDMERSDQGVPVYRLGTSDGLLIVRSRIKEHFGVGE